MDIFDEHIISEYIEWKNANPNNFSWWNYVNMKADLKTALAFAKFFSPELIQIEGCIFLKDKFTQEIYDLWNEDCNKVKMDIEKMVNLYSLDDFFHINSEVEENHYEQLQALGKTLKHYWNLNFKEQFPEKNIKIDVFKEDDDIFITIYENKMD